VFPAPVANNSRNPSIVPRMNLRAHRSIGKQESVDCLDGAGDLSLRDRRRISSKTRDTYYPLVSLSLFLSLSF